MFDAALIESGKSPSPGSPRRSLPLAIGLHAGFIGTLIGAGAWSAGEPPEPEIPVVVVFPVSPPPPSPADGPAPQTRRSSSGLRLSAPNTDSDPRSEVAENADPAEIAVSDAPTDSVADGTVGNAGSGVPGGTGWAEGSPGVPGSSGEPIPVGGDVRPPQLLTRVEPEYPETLRRQRVEGVVILEAVITTAGDVESVRVLKSANPVLDRAATDAIRRWRYRPATLNGRPVAVYLTVTASFGLR